MKGCQYIGYFYCSENLNWAAKKLRLGHMLPASWTWLISAEVFTHSRRQAKDAYKIVRRQLSVSSNASDVTTQQMMAPSQSRKLVVY